MVEILKPTVMKAIETFLNQIINLTRKNGAFVLKAEQQELLAQFRDFDVTTDWMEGKDITKIEKIILTYLHQGLGVNPSKDAQRQCRLYGIIYLTSARIDQVRGFEFSYEKLTEEVKQEVDQLVALYRTLTPLADKWQVMRETRAMMNGKLPKEEREKREREAIKGKLDPQLRKALEQVTEKFRIVVRDYYVNYFINLANKAVEFYSKPQPAKNYDQAWYAWSKEASRYQDVFRNGNRLDDTTLTRKGHEVADMECDSFFMKMADKLGGLVGGNAKLAKIEDVLKTKSDPFQSQIRFIYEDGTSFEIENKVVLNWSPLGNPFNQFPCTFHNAKLANGKKIVAPNEYSVKAAFNEFYALNA